MFFLKAIEKSDERALKAAIASIALRHIGAIALQPNVVAMNFEILHNKLRRF
ncbi:hypothetical protein [Nostoc sp. TCL240-02]|uniref:hypothetical protein n=1 Tax=Nostoc sp. TCL240-02 TaxID=2572090 RepID=UPI00157F847E|nr:hypothetical protein [Nostoc sp. TCL240-02]